MAENAPQAAMSQAMTDIKSANAKIALQAALSGDGEPVMTPFDESCIHLMDRVATFFGECASDPEFCGLSVDEIRDADQRLLSLTLVPCDMVGGEAARRVARPR